MENLEGCLKQVGEPGGLEHQGFQQVVPLGMAALLPPATPETVHSLERIKREPTMSQKLHICIFMQPPFLIWHSNVSN